MTQLSNRYNMINDLMMHTNTTNFANAADSHTPQPQHSIKKVRFAGFSVDDSVSERSNTPANVKSPIQNGDMMIGGYFSSSKGMREVIKKARLETNQRLECINMRTPAIWKQQEETYSRLQQIKRETAHKRDSQGYGTNVNRTFSTSTRRKGEI